MTRILDFHKLPNMLCNAMSLDARQLVSSVKPQLSACYSVSRCLTAFIKCLSSVLYACECDGDIFAPITVGNQNFNVIVVR
jgi:hypothetical protein